MFKKFMKYKDKFTNVEYIIPEKILIVILMWTIMDCKYWGLI